MESGSLIEKIKSRLSTLEAEVAELKRLVEELEEMKEIEESQIPSIPEISSNPKKVDGRLIADLRKAIGLNDRIRFQRELFGGDASLMNSTIDALNNLSSLADAMEYVVVNFKWDDDNDTVKYFKEILSRKAY